MTESEWQASADPAKMLFFMRRRISLRQECLIACGCVRRVWDLLQNENSRAAVEVTERFAEGLVTEAELQAAHDAAEKASYVGGYYQATRAAAAATMAAKTLPGDASARAADAFAYSVTQQVEHWRLVRDQERARQADLLRDIVGNPFQPRPARYWPSHVVGLARAIYQEGDPHVYPILADALEEFGESDMAQHCRQAGHVRGCWVVDTVLGKG
jgi:hypothetical protein